MGLLAHRKDTFTQSLFAHLEEVAKIASDFATSLNNADWAYYAGLFHDLGKSDTDWQKYLNGEKTTSVNHSEAGAQYVYSKMNPNNQAAKIIPYIIAGHHAGLPDWSAGSGNSLKSILEKTDKEYLEKLLLNSDLKKLQNVEFPKSTPFGKNDLSKDNPKELLEHFHLWIRMLYSCLVDADFLDTEQFMTPDKSELRGNYASLLDLKQKFDSFMTEKSAKAVSSKINTIRAEILKYCREKAKLKPGFFSLNVSTGGGKTLSSMAFALEHAVVHNKKRIIMAIPYKCLFGEENVLEHHCNFDFDKELVLSLINRNEISSDQFETTASGAVLMNDTGRKSLINAYQKKKEVVLNHPYVDKKNASRNFIPYTSKTSCSLFARRY